MAKEKTIRLQIDHSEGILVFGEENSTNKPLGLELRGKTKKEKIKNAIYDVNKYYAEEFNQWVYHIRNEMPRNRFINATPKSYKTDRIWLNRVYKKLEISEEENLNEIILCTEDCHGPYDESKCYEDAVKEFRNHYYG